ncbi:hypothetical protein PJM37_0100 [Salmonella phage vB_SenM_UTK0004]|nr:hypothetical protein PJM37_0100 [Salmonella phage vB_SenM_UTK0004]
MSIPFVYCLKSKDGHLYFGSKIGEDSDPKQLMETYFTSSKYVKDLMKTKGNDYFQVVGIEIFPGKPEEAFWKEQQLIESSYDNPMLLNKHYQTVGTKPWTQLGRKGNKQYLFGKGHLRAGKNNPMFGKQGAMKGITGKDHPAYGVDRSGDKNGMFGKCGGITSPLWNSSMGSSNKQEIGDFKTLVGCRRNTIGVGCWRKAMRLVKEIWN